jgi:hypothetical protein
MKHTQSTIALRLGIMQLPQITVIQKPKKEKKSNQLLLTK